MLVAPRGLPPGLALKLSAAVRAVLVDPAVAQRMTVAGVDPMPESTPETTRAFLVAERTKFAGIVERSSTKPLIAAVEGYALAGGFEIVLACDLIVASRGSKFGLPEVKRSLVAAGGGLLRLPHRVPYHVAMEMCLLGDAVPAEQMVQWGLVNRLVEDGEALASARELAARIARNGPLSLAATKQILVHSSDWKRSDAFALQNTIADPVAASADAREGAIAFAEKRDPVWTGR